MAEGLLASINPDSIPRALAALDAGVPLFVADSPDRENEVDFVVAAAGIQQDTVARLIRYSTGVICAAMDGTVCDQLQLPPMVTDNQDYKHTAFTVTCDARQEFGTTTGISAHDRAITLRMLADPAVTPSQFARPGHIFPLRAVDGGVFWRDGHTEAGVDLVRLAGLLPHARLAGSAAVAAIVEAQHDDGAMLRLSEVRDFTREHGLVDEKGMPLYPIITIEALKKYRKERGV